MSFIRPRAAVFAGLLATVIVAACETTQLIDPVTGEPVWVSVTPRTDVLRAINASLQLQIVDRQGRPVTVTGITWRILDPGIVQVDQNGRVTATAAGSARIVVEDANNADTVTIQVRQDVATVVVSPTTPMVIAGGSQQLTPALSDPNGFPVTDRAVTWASSNINVATVSGNGLVSAHTPGSATISAAAEGRAGTAALSVNAAPVVPVATVTLSPSAATVDVAQTQQLTATLRDAGGAVLAGRVITWTSSANGTATVSSSGSVTAIAQGTATITATSEGRTATSTITVPQPPPPPPIPVASVGMSPTTMSLQVGQTGQVTATPRNAAGSPLTGRVVTWTTSAPGVAGVSSAGLVTAAGTGTATITATSEGQTGTVAVTVAAVPVASVGVTPPTMSLQVGQTGQATATPRNAAGGALTGRVVTWTTTAASVATVNSSGVVTAVAAGSATITATSEGQSGSVAVTVTPVPVATVSVSPSTSSRVVGQTVQLAATPRDAAGNPLVGRAVTWTSSAAGIATVSTSGLVTALSAGTATITATSEGRTGSATVAVTAPPPVGALFADDFEAGALGDPNRWHDILGNFAIVTASSEGISAPPSGTKVMRVQATGGAITHFVASGATSPYTHLRLAYSMYRKTGYGSPGLRSGLIRGSRTQWGSFGTASTCPDDPNNATGQEFFITALYQPSGLNWQLRMYNYWLGQRKDGLNPPLCWGTHAVGPNDNPLGTYHDLTFTPVEDRWYRYEIELQLNTPGVADGWEKVWVDGVLKMEHRNVNYRNDPLTRIWAVTIDVGNTTVGTAYVDDLVVTSAGTTPPPPAPVASVGVAPTSLNLTVGQTGQLTATPRDAAGAALTGRVVAWTTTAAAVATVSSAGLVTAVGAGSATIRATSEGQVGTVTVTVTAPAPAPVASVSVSPTTAALVVGQSIQLAATPRDAGGAALAGRVVTWTTTAGGVATVSTSGFVTAAGVGTATITATSEGRSATASVTVTAPPVGGGSNKAEPIFSRSNPDHKLHVEETWANLTSINSIDAQPRSDGGPAWFSRGAKQYGAVVNQPDGFGSVRHVTLDYDRSPPIAPHGTGVHAAGYHWAGAKDPGDWQGDDNAGGNGAQSGSMNRGFDIIDASGFLNRPSRGSVVYEWAIRTRGTNFFMGKMMDINSANAGGAVGRFDYDAWSANLGIGGTFNCTDVLCRLYYSNNGQTPLRPGLPDHYTRIAPNITRSISGENIFFKQNMGFGMASGQYSYGAGPWPWGSEETNPHNNAAADGTGKHVWEAGWLYHKIRLTKEPPGSPYVAGRGRIEMWVGTAPGSMVKVMEYFGDPGELAAGLVTIDPSGNNELLSDLHVYSLAQRSYRGGALLDIGLIRVWSHSRM